MTDYSKKQMTDYSKKWKGRKSEKVWICLCGLVYSLIMAWIIFYWRMRLGAAGGLVTAVTVVSLAAVTGICYPVLWRKEEGVGGRQEDAAALYRMLEGFKDTVLFEYLYRDGVIRFTPDASKQIRLSVLKRALEKYVKFPPASGEIICFEFRMKSDTEDYRWCICRIRAEYGKTKKPVRLIGKLDDISKQKEREEQLLFQSTRDGLTGVYNKTAFEYIMGETLKRGGCGSLYMIDIDNFKDVNDQYGHPAGDRILIKLGEMLQGIFRGSDLIGRVGGDEFVVYSERGETKERALRLLNAAAAFIPEEGFRISVSMGIASGTGEAGEEYQELFSRADHAMYRAKQEGKNRIAFYKE